MTNKRWSLLAILFLLLLGAGWTAYRSFRDPTTDVPPAAWLAARRLPRGHQLHEDDLRLPAHWLERLRLPSLSAVAGKHLRISRNPLEPIAAVDAVDRPEIPLSCPNDRLFFQTLKDDASGLLNLTSDNWLLACALTGGKDVKVQEAKCRGPFRIALLHRSNGEKDLSWVALEGAPEDDLAWGQIVAAESKWFLAAPAPAHPMECRPPSPAETRKPPKPRPDKQPQAHPCCQCSSPCPPSKPSDPSR